MTDLIAFPAARLDELETTAHYAGPARVAWLSLHDAAAAGEVPEPARDADAPAEGLALSAVAATVVTNYQTCHENAEQLKALQDWIRQTR